MEEVYDLHLYTHLAVCHKGETELNIEAASTSTRLYRQCIMSLSKETCIIYDKEKENILSWGDDQFACDNKDNIRIDRFLEKLYQLYKTDKESWSQDNLFLLKTVSNFMHLSVKELREYLDEEIKDKDLLHYIFVIPSEWEEEIREVLLRPMFVQAGLISKDDHKDRLLFCSDLESLFYLIVDTIKDKISLNPGKSTILCRNTLMEENKILIKLDLVSIVNLMFDFSGAVLYSKIVRSNSLSFTIDDVKDSIRECLENGLDMSYDYFLSDTSEEADRIFLFMKPLFADTSEYSLDKDQEVFMKSFCLFDIFTELGKIKSNIIKDLVLSNTVKEYNMLLFCDMYSSGKYRNENLFKWLKYLLIEDFCYGTTMGKNIRDKNIEETYARYSDVLMGARRYGFDAIMNSDLNCKSRIISVKKSTASSVFPNSKFDAVMNIDISWESTLLSFSILDENGFIEKFWNHDYFVTDSRFITFAKEYLAGDNGAVLNKDVMTEIQSILNVENNTKSLLLTLNQVVTEFNLDEDQYQEAIIIRDKIIRIPNIYNSLCLNLWTNIIEDKSLIQLCDTHKEYSDIDLLDIFSLENKDKFTSNFKQYISEKNIITDLNCQIADKRIIQFSASYPRIKMLKEKSEDFMLEQGIDTPHYILSKSLNNYTKPVCQQRYFLHKGFQIGTLHHVYGENYGVGFRQACDDTDFEYKRDEISDCQTNQTFYMIADEQFLRAGLNTKYFKLKALDGLKDDGTVCLENIYEDMDGPLIFGNTNGFGEGQGMPFAISAAYEPYSSSLNFISRMIGSDVYDKCIATHAEPMALVRF
ncbi:hypothetical protein INT48_002524 [Thamnidium elegans]|uniref:Uncharacterized protein n=1 Tax=Thamnidium elegans TaxID=101142 RepID=A0A8H7T0U7_9FUNG|nr:hypothetical protein INT48_002524 [Thamnidium elegans]